MFDKEESVPLPIRFQKDIYERLKKEAKRQHMPVSVMVRRWIIRILEDAEFEYSQGIN